MDTKIIVRGSGPLAGFEARVIAAELDCESDDGLLLTLDRAYELGGQSHTTAVILHTNGLLLTVVGAFDLLHVPTEQMLLLQKLNDELLGRG